MNRKEPKFIYFSIVIALMFWLFESAMHYFVFGEIKFEVIPLDINEFWMRLIIFLMIVGGGIYTQFSTKKLIKLRVNIAEKEARVETLRITIHEVHDIVNNFLNNLLLFRMEAEESKAISKDSLELFDRIVNETSSRIKIIGESEITK